MHFSVILILTRPALKGYVPPKRLCSSSLVPKQIQLDLPCCKSLQTANFCSFYQYMRWFMTGPQPAQCIFWWGKIKRYCYLLHLTTKHVFGNFEGMSIARLRAFFMTAVSKGAIASPKTYESNLIHLDFAQFEKQHSRYKAILPSIVYLISLKVVNP